jgi:hypothetical protein
VRVRGPWHDKFREVDSNDSATMRAVQVPSTAADFELVERDVPTPDFGEALV